MDSIAECALLYRAWGYPWTTAAALVGSIAFLIGAIASDTTNSLLALGALAASYPAFKVFGSVRRDAYFHIQSD